MERNEANKADAKKEILVRWSGEFRPEWSNELYNIVQTGWPSLFRADRELSDTETRIRSTHEECEVPTRVPTPKHAFVPRACPSLELGGKFACAARKLGTGGKFACAARKLGTGTPKRCPTRK